MFHFVIQEGNVNQPILKPVENQSNNIKLKVLNTTRTKTHKLFIYLLDKARCM